MEKIELKAEAKKEGSLVEEVKKAALKTKAAAKEKKPAKRTTRETKETRATKEKAVETADMNLEGAEGMLIPIDDYVKSGIYLGTKVITRDMKSYVYKRRNDGLAIINTKLIDEKIKDAISFISHYEPKEIIAVCKREAGWKALKSFSESTGIKVFTKKYPSGIITNPVLEGYFEPSLIMIVDAWLDKNPIADAMHANIPVVGVCDTNNLTTSIDLVVPGNNKSTKSIGLIFWLLAKGYIQKKGLNKPEPQLKDFIAE